MTNSKSSFEIENKGAERSLNTRDSAMSNSVINDKNDNVMQLRLQERQSLSSLRLTRDPNNSFTIDMGANVQARNLRSLSAPAVTFMDSPGGNPKVAAERLNPVSEKISAYSFEKIQHRHAYDVLHVAEKPLSVDLISNRVNGWIDHALTDLQLQRNQMSEPEYSGRVNELVNFRRDMREFRASALENGLKPSDVDKTFQQVHRLMLDDAGGSLDRNSRRLIAGQIMHYANHPTSIDQGNHNTCFEAALQSMMFTRHPGDAAKFIADIALTGEFVSNEKFRGSDGQMSPLKVSMQLEPDSEAEKFWKRNVRTFASEIFQVGAANLAYANQDKLQHNHLSYEQLDVEQQCKDFEKTGDYSDTGERIVDSQTGKFIGEGRSPNLSDKELPIMARAIAGKNNLVDTEIVNINSMVGSPEGTLAIKNLDDLKDKLFHLKTDHKLPVMIKVNVNCEPFYSDGKMSKNDQGGAHAVTIRDYNPTTGAVMVDNQWGDDNDHLQKNTINVRDLFVATLHDSEAAELFEHMIEEDKRRGVVDPVKRMQQLRLSNLAYELTDDDYEHSVREEVKAAANRWKGLSVKEKAAESEELSAMTRDLYLAPRLEITGELFQDGIITQKQFKTENDCISNAFFQLSTGFAADNIIPPPEFAGHRRSVDV